MKRINSLFIIVFSTLISVINMVSSDYYEADKSHRSLVVEYKKASDLKITNGGVKEVTKNNLKDKKYSSNYKSHDEKGSSLSVIPSNVDNKKNKDYNDSLESYYNYIEKNEKSVFKVSASKIKDELTASDKIKLLYVSMKLDKEDYKKVQVYLYDKDTEGGVLNALKLLKEDLSEKEYDKVREIAGKFIDMNLAEGLD